MRCAVQCPPACHFITTKMASREQNYFFQMREFKKKKKKKDEHTNQVTKKPKWTKSSAAGFSSSLSVFSPSHLTGALHAGVLRRNRRRHHGQDALWRLAVTVQTGSTGRPRNAGCTGNTAGSPQTFTTVFTVSWSTGVTWKNPGFVRTLWPKHWLNVWVFVPELSIYVHSSVIVLNFEILVLKLLYLGINNMINTCWITDHFHIKPYWSATQPSLQQNSSTI